MSLFQNTSLHAIPLMIGGIRKNIRPGEQFQGPEQLSSIPGLTLINPSSKTVLTKNNFNVEPQQNPYQFPDGNSSFNKEFSDELDYLTYMKSLNDKPSVTIAILTKNRLDLISNCCESIFEKVKYSNVTIMIIDTGTDEPSVRTYYSSLEEKCVNKKWKYKFIQLDSYHYSKNYNTAVNNHVDTEFVLIQNNDTVALNDYVTEMMGTAILRKVGSVGCRMVYPDKASIQHDGQTIFNAPNEQFGSASHIHLRQAKESVDKQNCFTHFVDGNTAAGVLMRTSDFKKVKGFDEKFSDIFQDVHLMIKIPNMLNRFNYCNRIANIIHIDNASRLQTGVDQKKHVQMWEDTHYLRKTLIENQWGRLKKPKQFDFSIITPVNNLDSYSDFLNSLKLQMGNHSVELIAIPNFYNNFNSAYKALNSGNDVASGKIIIYCHDDIAVSPEWLNKIKSHIESIENSRQKVGVIGPAGITKNEAGIYYLLNENGVPYNKVHASIDRHSTVNTLPRYEVQTLDEMCLITLKSNNLRFDDVQLTGWHFYGANLCIKAMSRGMSNWSIDAYTFHKSDGSKNLSSKEKYDNYEECARRFDTWAKHLGVESWRTTTAKSHSGILHLFPKRPE